MRLDKLVAEARRCTRKIARGFVRSGRVTVDGEVVRDTATKVNPGTQSVTLDGEPLAFRADVTLLLHKPAGVLTASRDSSRPTVLDLVPPDLQVRETSPRPLAAVGRLDLDTTGLLVLTTDGVLNHRLAHPTRHVAKTYRAIVSGDAFLAADRAELQARFSAGVVLKDGTVCRPARLRWLPLASRDAWAVPTAAVEVVLREGRYHQVKRMVAACGGFVEALHREAIGGLTLSGDLGVVGAIREALAADLERLFEEPADGSDAKEL